LLQVLKVRLDTCYSTDYMSRTHDQQHFTIFEVAANRHEVMERPRTMHPSTACVNGQLDLKRYFFNKKYHLRHKFY